MQFTAGAERPPAHGGTVAPLPRRSGEVVEVVEQGCDAARVGLLHHHGRASLRLGDVEPAQVSSSGREADGEQ
ncbi:hypothetical protein [Arenibaculum sp.]|jgi:hypothetical protein|uniref:hypothetical protein n=1 Tax=Arenibaculum sp. TaxID=2865862 RepID=UPI002E10E592|nr:hypothetical protein [Arenibaculum sp.]